MGQSAQSALDKITAVIPAELRTKIEDSKLFSLRFSQRQDLDINLDICRKAIDSNRLLQISYCRADGEQSLRRSGRWAFIFGGTSGPWSAGASCATISAISGWIGFKAFSRKIRHSQTSRAKACRTLSNA